MKRWLAVLVPVVACGGRTELTHRADNDAADVALFECGDAGATCAANTQYCGATDRGAATYYVCGELPADCNACDCVVASLSSSWCNCIDDEGRLTVLCPGR